MSETVATFLSERSPYVLDIPPGTPAPQPQPLCHCHDWSDPRYVKGATLHFLGEDCTKSRPEAPVHYAPEGSNELLCEAATGQYTNDPADTTCEICGTLAVAKGRNPVTIIPS